MNSTEYSNKLFFYIVLLFNNIVYNRTINQLIRAKSALTIENITNIRSGYPHTPYPRSPTSPDPPLGAHNPLPGLCCQPFISRAMFLLTAGHVTAAYFGHLKGYGHGLPEVSNRIWTPEMWICGLFKRDGQYSPCMLSCRFLLFSCFGSFFPVFLSYTTCARRVLWDFISNSPLQLVSNQFKALWIKTTLKDFY